MSTVTTLEPGIALATELTALSASTGLQIPASVVTALTSPAMGIQTSIEVVQTGLVASLSTALTKTDLGTLATSLSQQSTTALVETALGTIETSLSVADPGLVTLISAGLLVPPSTGGVAELAEQVDLEGPVYTYVGYPSRIARVDYSQSPSVVLTFATNSLATDWPNRASLVYS